MNLRCPQHRTLPWLGHGECVNCGTLFKHLLDVGEFCPNCNARLVSFSKLRVEWLFRALAGARVTFSGRPLCAKCYGGRVAEGASSAARDVLDVEG